MLFNANLRIYQAWTLGTEFPFLYAVSLELWRLRRERESYEYYQNEAISSRNSRLAAGENCGQNVLPDFR